MQFNFCIIRIAFLSFTHWSGFFQSVFNSLFNQTNKFRFEIFIDCTKQSIWLSKLLWLWLFSMLSINEVLLLMLFLLLLNYFPHLFLFHFNLTIDLIQWNWTMHLNSAWEMDNRHTNTSENVSHSMCVCVLFGTRTIMLISCAYNKLQS